MRSAKPKLSNMMSDSETKFKLKLHGDRWNLNFKD